MMQHSCLHMDHAPSITKLAWAQLPPGQQVGVNCHKGSRDCDQGKTKPFLSSQLKAHVTGLAVDLLHVPSVPLEKLERSKWIMMPCKASPPPAAPRFGH